MTKTRYSIPRFFANSHIYLALYIFFILILKKASSIYSVDINYVTILHSIGISYIIYIVSKDIFVNYPSYYGECLRRLRTYWPFRCIGLLIASIVIMPIVDFKFMFPIFPEMVNNFFSLNSENATKLHSNEFSDLINLSGLYYGCILNIVFITFFFSVMVAYGRGELHKARGTGA